MSETDPLIEEVVHYSDDLSSEIIKKAYFSEVPNFFWIELSLLINVFLSGFDGTITASTYSTIGNEFEAISIAAWITTSYLIASTAFQPLYGSISDVLGRKSCIIFALVVFALGCYGCFLSPSIIWLIAMRAFTGIGGGGLICLSTITNSDIINPQQRGMFQAVQNLLLGFGAVCGASFGGVLVSLLSWRWCFLIQVFPTLFSLVVAAIFIPQSQVVHDTLESKPKIDYRGSLFLVSSLIFQLLILSTGGNELRWTDWRILLMALIMIGFTVLFYIEETTTEALPIIPIRKYKSKFVLLSLIQNYCTGLSSYAYLFTLPLLFQINLGDSVSISGLRLAIPALATPVGGIIAGYFMSKSKRFVNLALLGAFFMCLGNIFSIFISKSIPGWLDNLLLIPANLGQGMAYPSSLFLFIYYFTPSEQASSTSTVYLIRNIGSVWGVTYISAITNVVLKTRLKSHLSQLGYLSKKDIRDIIDSLLKSIEVLDRLDPEVKAIVVADYTLALRIAQAISAICCFVAVTCIYASKRHLRSS